MKLFVAPRAPNPRRVLVFLAEKGITSIELVGVDLNAGEHRSETFRAKSPLARVPVLELDDGRALGETRAICTYLEGLQPEPNLMGRDFEERAFIEAAPRARSRSHQKNARPLYAPRGPWGSTLRALTCFVPIMDR